MGGFFGVVSKHDAVSDVFFGTDYHSHLGTKRGGLAALDKEIGLQRDIHNIENVCDNLYLLKYRHFEERDIINFCRSAYVQTLEKDKTINSLSLKYFELNLSTISPHVSLYNIFTFIVYVLLSILSSTKYTFSLGAS